MPRFRVQCSGKHTLSLSARPAVCFPPSTAVRKATPRCNTAMCQASRGGRPNPFLQTPPGSPTQPGHCNRCLPVSLHVVLLLNPAYYSSKLWNSCNYQVALHRCAICVGTPINQGVSALQDNVATNSLVIVQPLAPGGPEPMQGWACWRGLLQSGDGLSST
jgi:hypothetical protein